MYIFGKQLGHVWHGGQRLCLYMVTGRLTRPPHNPDNTSYVGRLEGRKFVQEAAEGFFPPPFDTSLPLDELTKFAKRLRGTEAPKDVRFVIRDDYVPALGIGFDEHSLVTAAMVEGMRALDTDAYAPWRKLRMADGMPRG